MMPLGVSSRKLDATPMLPNGSKIIADWQIDQHFYLPFVGGVIDASHRLRLVNNLQAYLSELKKFDLRVEVWLDGSFTTKEPQPDDIDIVVMVFTEELNGLPDRDASFFARLTTNREYIRARYDIDVYLAMLDNLEETEYWTDKFSKGHFSSSPKGFFKIQLTHV